MQKEDFHILRLMGEIDQNGTHSQRELSSRLNISVGLVNTFIKRLVHKGYFKVKTMPRNRLRYFLTPEGLARKSKLTAEFLQYSVNFYRDIKHLLLSTYGEMEQNQIKSILFYGAGEVAELAYLYIQLTTIRLVGIVDEQCQGKSFFGLKVEGIERIHHRDWDMVLLTRLENTEEARKRLIGAGVTTERISAI